MRLAHRGALLTENNMIIGINLGADYCAEHEWGIKGIYSNLGIDKNKDKMGLDKRKITNHNDIIWLSNDKYNFLFLNHYNWNTYELTDDYKKIPGEFRPNNFNKENWQACWDENSFGILAKKECGFLNDLYAAFLKDDIAIWVGGGGIFENPGLVVAIYSRVSSANRDAMLKVDLDNKKLKDASESTGILAKLKKANKGYYACSPRWKGEFKKDTKYNVIYWLNPMDQHLNNYGWFSVEELEQWISGKGPIPK